MDFLGWMALAGGLLLIMALSSATLRNLPISTSVIYLALGLAIGPAGFDLLQIDLRQEVAWFERLTEVAVIVALFVGGLKLRLPLRDPAWIAAWRLGGPIMLATILGVAACALFLLDLPLATALILAAVLAPTDPVLAGTVKVSSAADHDRVRYALSGEAGLNDGMAFPFVIFGLLLAEHGRIGEWTLSWALHRLLWAVPAGLLLGFLLGRGVGREAIWLKSRQKDLDAPSDFLALALIALAYVGAETIGAWGFLATFAAGVGLRHAELHVSRKTPHRGSPDLPPEDLVGASVQAEELKEPAVAAGVLVAETISFGDTVERLLEVLLVVLVGILLARHWDPRAILLAAALFLVIRPVATQLLLTGTPTSISQRWLMGWFGIRGIGSLYYLSYVLVHGQSTAAAEDLTGLTLSTVALSILVHGITAAPLIARYERGLEG
ncbi:MAG: cation:proton antiporter [Gemmatimonadales bacterium]